eukprot:2693156-Amphidinium_carterae.1
MCSGQQARRMTLSLAHSVLCVWCVTSLNVALPDSAGTSLQMQRKDSRQTFVCLCTCQQDVPPEPKCCTHHQKERNVKSLETPPPRHAAAIACTGNCQCIRWPHEQFKSVCDLHACGACERCTIPHDIAHIRIAAIEKDESYAGVPTMSACSHHLQRFTQDNGGRKFHTRTRPRAL